MEQLREPAKLMDAGMGAYQLVSAIECWNNIGFVPDPLLHLGSYLSEDGLNVRNSSIGATLSEDSNSRSETLDMPCTVLPAIDATCVLMLPRRCYSSFLLPYCTCLYFSVRTNQPQ